jgi:DNA repair protein RadA/Sms
VAQVRDCTARLMRLAKATHVPIVIVGHVTKEGTIAGPRVLEHIVDTVLYLEGDRFHAYRLLRSVKNRYGSTNEVGVFEMRDTGLLAVENPSAAFLAERGDNNSPGSCIVVTLEGSRPLLVELQALVSQTGFSLPRRTSTGIDLNRLYILLAVLAKRVGLPMGNNDVYCNVVGGLKIGEPAADLGVALAVVSSFADVALPADLVAFGEVGLSGEVRSVSQVALRVNEAAKLGFTRCLLPAANVRGLKAPPGVTLTGVATVQDALRVVLPTGGPTRRRGPARERAAEAGGAGAVPNPPAAARGGGAERNGAGPVGRAGGSRAGDDLPDDEPLTADAPGALEDEGAGEADWEEVI